MTIAFTIVEDLKFEVKINHPNRMFSRVRAESELQKSGMK